VIFWLHSSSCSPSRLTSLTASSRSQTKAGVSFTWSAKHPMWSRSPTGITTASAPSRARLGKWRYCDCSICSSASYHSSAKASRGLSHTSLERPPRCGCLDHVMDVVNMISHWPLVDDHTHTPKVRVSTKQPRDNDEKRGLAIPQCQEHGP
jgi:hypothetical protein